MPPRHWLRQAVKSSSNAHPATSPRHHHHHHHHLHSRDSPIELLPNMPSIKEVPEEENPAGQTPVEARPEPQHGASSGGTPAAEGAANNMSIKEVLGLIYGDIRTAALEDEQYDPYKLVAEAEKMALEEAKLDSEPPPETTADAGVPATEQSNQSKSDRSKRTRFRDRASTFLSEAFPKLGSPGPRRPAAAGPARPEAVPEAQHEQAVAGELISPGAASHFAPPSDAGSKRVGSSYAASSVFELYQPNSPRDALVQGQHPTAQAGSPSRGAESIHSGSAHAAPGPKSNNNPPTTRASAAGNDNDSGSKRQSPFTSVAVRGGPSKIRARGALLAASNAIFESNDDPQSRSPRLNRIVAIAQEHGWMLLCIVAHSETFYELVNVDDMSWSVVFSHIARNALSIELYAAHCKLDWQWPLPPKAWPEVRSKLHYMNLGGRQVISLTGQLYPPTYDGNKQVEIEANFYRDVIWPNRKPRTTKIAGEAECALCGSFGLCACEVPNDPRTPVELRECRRRRGIRVRSLRAIKAGEMIGAYLGEMCSPPCRDTTWVVEQMAPGDNTTATICLLDASVHGNWTRYMRHSCRPAAVLISTTVGKELCVLVRAMRDIAVFDEITVDFGHKYFEPEDRVCDCGEACCRYGDKGKKEPKGKERADQAAPTKAGSYGGSKASNTKRKGGR